MIAVEVKVSTEDLATMAALPAAPAAAPDAAAKILFDLAAKLSAKTEGGK
jgi:hypothetical protein